MGKIKLAVIAIVDGAVIIAAMTAVIIGIIYATTVSVKYGLMALAPAPAIWLHLTLNRLCDRIGKEEPD